MTTPMIERDGPLDPVTHSPDGESRGLAFRVGDIFPMDPGLDQASQLDAPKTQARPWGLRYLMLPRAGKHDKGTAEYTTGNQGDRQSPEDKGTD